MDICFLDTETLGLDPQAPIWEFAAIRVRPGFPVETREFTIKHLPDQWVDEMAAQGTKGAALAADYESRYRPEHALHAAEAAKEIHAITDGAQVIGCNPGFDLDSRRLSDLLWENGIEPAWHYHPDDISSMAKGWLAAAGRLPAPPWSSDQLSIALGVDPAKFARHTAMGDCRWVQAQYAKIMQPAPRLESLPAAAVADVDMIAAAIEAAIRTTFTTVGDAIGVDGDLDNYVMVHLPEPVGINGTDNCIWSREPHYIEQEFNGDIVINDRLGIDADDLAAVGSILLAANKSAGGNR